MSFRVACQRGSLKRLHVLLPENAQSPEISASQFMPESTSLFVRYSRVFETGFALPCGMFDSHGGIGEKGFR
jgi:hypothetical protein